MPDGRFASVGLLLLRISIGSMMLGHGLGKLRRYGDLATRFSDPLGVGHETSLQLAIFAEAFCAAAVLVGAFTRASAFVVTFTMLVAGLVVHADDPFAKKELALVFAAAFGLLVFTGGGRYSLDHRLR